MARREKSNYIAAPGPDNLFSPVLLTEKPMKRNIYLHLASTWRQYCVKSGD